MKWILSNWKRYPLDAFSSPGVNFTNILWAAFAPKSFHQIITKPNCKHLKAVQRTLVWLSISPIFYKQLFHTKVTCTPFMCLQFGFVIFWRKEFWCKSCSWNVGEIDTRKVNTKGWTSAFKLREFKFSKHLKKPDCGKPNLMNMSQTGICMNLAKQIEYWKKWQWMSTR